MKISEEKCNYCDNVLVGETEPIFIGGTELEVFKILYCNICNKEYRFVSLGEYEEI